MLGSGPTQSNNTLVKGSSIAQIGFKGDGVGLQFGLSTYAKIYKITNTNVTFLTPRYPAKDELWAKLNRSLQKHWDTKNW